MAPENTAQIQKLEEDLKTAFKEKRYNDVRLIGQQLKGLDPKNRVALKLTTKVEKIEAKAAKKAAKEQAKKTVAEAKKMAKEKAKAEKAKAQEAKKVAKKVATPAPVPKGNIFTKLFQKEVAATPGKTPEAEPKEGSIIETIVSQTDEGKEAEKAAKVAQKKEEEKKPDTAIGFLRFSKAFFNLAVLFIVITAAFLYVQNIDTENRVLSLFTDKQNIASRLFGAAEELGIKQDLVRDLQSEIKLYRGGYNNQYENTISQIVEKRIDWNDIVGKIDEITESVYEKNALAQYVKYDSYSLDVDSDQIRVSGTLSDPLGKNLTKLIELEEAFKYYPGTKETVEAKKEQPYFYNVSSVSSVSKSLNRQTGKFTSNFQVSFSREEDKEAKPRGRR